MKVEILETESIKEFGVPKYADLGSSGVDLRASEDAIINPGERKLIHTGVKIALPKEVYIEQTDSFISFEAQVRPRSGLALKNGITVLNTPGTIDESYRGEVGVIVFNTSNEDFKIEKGYKIAQLVLCPIMKFNFKVVESLDETDRVGGFGSTGVK